MIPAADRRARWAVAVIFLVNGSMLGSWAGQIPLAKERLGLDYLALSVALLGMAVGALVAMPLSGPLIARLGSATVTRISAVVLCLALPLPVLAPDVVTLTTALLLFGAANGIMDVAMNAHGVAVERRLGRPVMSSYHGMFSLGGLIGAGLAALLLPILPPILQAGLAAAAGLAASAAVLPMLLPASVDSQSGGPAFAVPDRTSLLLGLLCFLAMVSEGAVLDWSALHLQNGLAVGAGTAAVGFAAFSAAMALSRFSGDAIRARFGSTPLVRTSAFIGAAGLALALLTSSPLLAVVGFAVVGIGLGNVVPVLYGAAGALPGQASGSAIAAVATMGYAGFLAGPPVIGFVADASSLTVGLGVVVAACVVVGLGAAAASPADTVRGGAEPASAGS